MTHILHRSPNAVMPVAVSGSGVEITDAEGRVKREAMALGLMVYPMGGAVDGVQGDHVLLAPPFIVDGSQVDAIVDLLGGALDAALDDVQ